MSKGYLKASWQFLMGIGKQLGNDQIPAVSQEDKRQNCPAAIGKNMEIFCSFPQKCCISISKNKKSFKFFKNSQRLLS
jgi:hypothetical protein